MGEYDSQANIDIVVDDRSLTEARATVEDALSAVPADIQAEVSASGGGGGGEVAARDRARQRQLLTSQTESIEGLREEIAEDDVSSEWQEQHALSRERNRLLEKMIETQEEGDFDRAKRLGGSLGGAAAGAIGAVSLLGVGALGSILSNFSWPSLPEFTWPELPPLEPPGPPGWTPIEVAEPNQVPVEPNPDSVPIESPDPSEYPLEEPQPEGYPVAEPDPAEYPVEDPGQVDAPPEPGWTPIEIGMPELSTEGVGSGIGLPELLFGGALGAAGAAGASALQGIGSSSAGAAASGAGALLIPEAIGITDHEKMNRRRRAFNKRTPEFMNMEMMSESEEHPGSVFSAEGRQAQAEGVRDLISAIKDLQEDVRNTQEETSTTRRTEVNFETEISVDGATRREVERAANQAKEQALRKFNQRIRNER